MQELFKKYIHAADMEELVKQNIRQAVNDMAETLANNWDDAVAMSLYETLGDYIALATKPTDEVVSAPITQDEPTTKRKKRNTPDKYVPASVRTKQFQALWDILTHPDNLGKPTVVTPEDIGGSIADLRAITTRFNNCNWREKNAPNSKLRAKQQLTNCVCQLVRADENLRGKRFICN